ncbi:MAG: hypothetical protein WBZ36_14045 [Candidatus Nitrosopolaris sp.]
MDQIKRQYDFTIKGAKVFATANDLNKLSAPLFGRLHLPKYTKERFLDIAIKVCPLVTNFNIASCDLLCANNTYSAV